MTWERLIRARLRDGVFGAQDGLISTLGALTGIAGGTGDRAVVLLSGAVVIAVESLSMGAGAYLSSKAQTEYLERLLREEKESIEKNPEQERWEVRDMYGKRGYTAQEIGVIEGRLFSNKALLLEDMAHKELGIIPDRLEEPVGNGLVMGAVYALGGLVPLAPYIFMPIKSALPVSVAGTLLALFALGMGKGRLVGKTGWRSGLEMLLIAGVAALAGWLVGQTALFVFDVNSPL
jgi:VIT1/CCC1 family predicted Fe2+/Mn2+ transporter